MSPMSDGFNGKKDGKGVTECQKAMRRLQPADVIPAEQRCDGG